MEKVSTSTSKTSVKNFDHNRQEWENPIQLDGMEFLEFAAPDPDEMERLFFRLGFKMIAKHKSKNVYLYRQGKVQFVLNKEPGSFAEKFYKEHGPSICATGFKVKDAKHAFTETVKRGARPFKDEQSHSFQTIYGIGDSAIYFVDKYENLNSYSEDFVFFDKDMKTEGFGFKYVDHMTNNVPNGEMMKWCDFYEGIFNFKEVRFFDIKGQKTGLSSKVMRSPCQKIVIPINEPTEGKSQIQEYLDEYQGSGIQHVALATDDIIETVRQMKRQGLEFLDTPDSYYDMLKERVPNVTEDIEVLKELKILVDGDDEGYLLQIFTKNLIGPIFLEVIQRKNHFGFGEGNFQALFDAIERDQKARGYLD